MQTTSRTESSNPSISVLHLENMVVRNQVSFGIGRMDSELEINDQDNTQTPNSPSTDCGSSILTFILNIPKEIMNFFAGIINYLTSFCHSPTEIPPPALDMSALQTLIDTRYEGTKWQKRAAFMQGFNALPEEAKEIVYTNIGMMIGWDTVGFDGTKHIPVDPKSQEALPILQEELQTKKTVVKLQLQAWILERERSGVPHVLASEQYELAAVRTFIETPLAGSEEEQATAFLNGLNDLPQTIKELINTAALTLIFIEDKKIGPAIINDINLKATLQTLLPNNSETTVLIQNKIKNNYVYMCGLIISWSNTKERAIAARNQIASVNNV